jgi:hypothetical protein
MEHARRDQPAGAALQTVGLGEVDDSVVATVPALQALPHVVLRSARFEPHEGVGKVVVAVVVLRREVVALGLALLPHQLGVVERLVHVVRDRAHVVEELRIHGPLLVAVPDRLADEPGAPLDDGVAEQEPLPLEHAPRQALVGDAALVGGLGRAREPPLVDAAAVEPVGVVVVGVQPHPLAGVEETPGHPGGREPKDAPAGVEGPPEGRGDVLGLWKQRGFASGRFHTKNPRIQVCAESETVVRPPLPGRKPPRGAPGAAIAYILCHENTFPTGRRES